jgi:hypothetical protein
MNPRITTTFLVPLDFIAPLTGYLFDLELSDGVTPNQAQGISSIREVQKLIDEARIEKESTTRSTSYTKAQEIFYNLSVDKKAMLETRHSVFISTLFRLIEEFELATTLPIKVDKLPLVIAYNITPTFISIALGYGEVEERRHTYVLNFISV